MRSWLAASMIVIGPMLAILPASAAAEEPMGLHPEVIAAFEAYLQAPRPGAFAVSRDGASFGQSLCDDARCNRAGQRRAALQLCDRDADAPCEILASGDDVSRAYRPLSRAEISACPLSPVPAIRVTLEVREVAFDRGQTVADLSHLIFDDERHWIDEQGTAMGVTEHFFDIDRDRIGFVEVEGRDGVRCVGYKDGEIVLTLDTTIHVAEEIPEDTCLYREVLAHEHKHRALGHALSEQFARDLEAGIAAQLADQPYAEIPEGETPWFVAERRLDAMIGAAHGVFRREQSRQQLAIDSNDEYRRVDLACPSESERYAPAPR